MSPALFESLHLICNSIFRVGKPLRKARWFVSCGDREQCWSSTDPTRCDEVARAGEGPGRAEENFSWSHPLAGVAPLLGPCGCPALLRDSSHSCCAPTQPFFCTSPMPSQSTHSGAAAWLGHSFSSWTTTLLLAEDEGGGWWGRHRSHSKGNLTPQTLGCIISCLS